MKFSVLMSVYAKENPDYFNQALESITTQTCMPNEIVIVQDGPLPDALHAVIKNFQKRFSIIKTIPLQYNNGLGIALNAGIKACSYAYIARMDADDIALPERFEKQIAFIKKHPNTTVIGSNVVEYDESMNLPISTKVVPQHQAEIDVFLKRRNPFNHMSVMYSKQAVLDCGSYEDCPYFEDYYLWCKLAKAGGYFYNIPENLIKVRAGAAMYTRRGGLSYVKHIINFQTKIYNLGIISRSEFISNVGKRAIVSIVPNQLRAAIYKKALRSQN